MRKALIVAAALAAAVINAAAAQDASTAPPAAGLVAQPDPVVFQAQIEAARLRHEDWLACVQARRFKCEAKRDPMDDILNDDTLVAGDIVATPQGLKVFHGQPGTPHKWEDFR